MDEPADALVNFARELRYDAIPDEITEKGKLHILDGIGAALLSVRVQKSADIASTLQRVGGAGDYTVWAHEFKSPLFVAATINGMLAEALDYSDIHVGAQLHPTAVVLPAVLTVGEGIGASGKDILCAYILGCELMIRLGKAAPGRFHARGFQPTSVLGVPAAALAVGTLLKMSAMGLKSALAIASTLAFGSSLSVGVGSYFGGVDTGRAAESGILAALLANNGVEAIVGDSMEGRYGLFPTFAGEGSFDFGIVTEALGHRWEFKETFIKRYPTSYVHTNTIDAALALKRDHHFATSQIEEIAFGDTKGNLDLFSEPEDIKRVPPSIYQAKTSHFFLLASALAHGKVDASTLSRTRLRSVSIRGLISKMSAQASNSRWVRVRLRNGAVFEQAQNQLIPTSTERGIEKFLTNATSVVGRSRARQIQEKVFSLENVINISKLTGLLSQQANRSH